MIEKEANNIEIISMNERNHNLILKLDKRIFSYIEIKKEEFIKQFIEDIFRKYENGIEIVRCIYCTSLALGKDTKELYCYRRSIAPTKIEENANSDQLLIKWECNSNVGACSYFEFGNNVFIEINYRYLDQKEKETHLGFKNIDENNKGINKRIEVKDNYINLIDFYGANVGKIHKRK